MQRLLGVVLLAAGCGGGGSAMPPVGQCAMTALPPQQTIRGASTEEGGGTPARIVDCVGPLAASECTVTWDNGNRGFTFRVRWHRTPSVAALPLTQGRDFAVDLVRGIPAQRIRDGRVETVNEVEGAFPGDLTFAVRDGGGALLSGRLCTPPHLGDAIALFAASAVPATIATR